MSKTFHRIAATAAILLACQGARADGTFDSAVDAETLATEKLTKPGAWDGWLDLFKYTPPAGERLAPVMTTLPINQAAGELAGRGVFALAANEQSCLAADSIRWGWQGRSVLYSRLAYLAYVSDADARALARKRDERQQKPNFGEGSSALRKQEAAELKLGTRLELKERYLVQTRFVAHPELLESFRKAKGLTQERLDKMTFHAELYSRDDEWVLVFRGTVGALGGWATNLAQILSVVNTVDNGVDDKDGAIGQYGVADSLVKHLLASGIPRDKLYVTGHSLGGGLASYTHLANNLAGALTFNPAQLGAASRSQLAKQPFYQSAQGRMANYMSQSKTDMDSADPVSQGTATVSALLSKIDINVPSWGSLHGATFYIPIEEEAVPAAWRNGVPLAGAGLGVLGSRGVQASAAVGLAARGADENRETRNQTGIATAAGAATGVALFKVATNPVKSLVKAVGGAVYAHSVAKEPMELLWHEYLLHSMQPLATALASNGVASATTTCTSPPDSAFLAEKAARNKGLAGKLEGLTSRANQS